MSAQHAATAASCSAAGPCLMARGSYGLELDFGAPGIRVEYFVED
jgi:hypothetical protein